VAPAAEFEYGAHAVPAVGKQLEARYGRGFGEKNLRRVGARTLAIAERSLP